MITYMRNEASENKTVALCHCQKHYGNLSVRLMKQHDCLNKGCPYFEKYEDHPYWAQRKRIREKRNQRRKLSAGYLEEGVKKLGKIGIVRSEEKPVIADKAERISPFKDVQSFFSGSETCKAYSIICLTHGVNEYGEREPYPILDSVEEYFSTEDALDSMMRKNLKKGKAELLADYLLIDSASGERRGYRIDYKNKVYHEIDLNWGALYPMIAGKAV